VLDLFSRKMLGYAVSEHHDAELAVASLRMAAAIRGGTIDWVIFHSDRDSEEHTGETFEAACRRLDGLQSMGAGSARHWTTPPARHSTRPSRWSTSTSTGSAPASKHG
jgi:transposase InsO family protein